MNSAEQLLTWAAEADPFRPVTGEADTLQAACCPPQHPLQPALHHHGAFAQGADVRRLEVAARDNAGTVMR